MAINNRQINKTFIYVFVWMQARTRMQTVFVVQGSEESINMFIEWVDINQFWVKNPLTLAEEVLVSKIKSPIWKIFASFPAPQNM